MALLFILFGLTLYFLFTTDRELRELRKELYNININLSLVAKIYSVDLLDGDNLDERVNTLLMGGHKVKAIKLYKDATGSTLAESKEYISLLLDE